MTWPGLPENAASEVSTRPNGVSIIGFSRLHLAVNVCVGGARLVLLIPAVLLMSPSKVPGLSKWFYLSCPDVVSCLLIPECRP